MVITLQADAQQQAALDLIRQGHSLVVVGAPGTGKSWLIKEAVQILRGSGKNVAITASTGIAADNLRNLGLKTASTVHSFTGIKYRLEDIDTASKQ